MVIAGSYYICIFNQFTHNLFHFAFINTKIRFVVQHVYYWMYMFGFLQVIVHSNVSQLFRRLKNINIRIIFIYMCYIVYN